MISEGPLRGESLLGAVSKAMVSLHERYHGRVRVTAKAEMMGDDLLVCVLGDACTDIEKKMMIEPLRTTTVQETRSIFQQAMHGQFIETIERLSGRQVLEFSSKQHVAPELEIQLFVLARGGANSSTEEDRRRTNWR